MSAIRKVLRALVPIAVLALGAVALVLLVKSRPTPKKEPRQERGALVEVVPVRSVNERLRVTAHGSVVPAEQVVLVPEVTGKIVWQSRSLVPGGRFKKGEMLLRIDARDYHLMANQQSAAVERARAELTIEESRKELAKEEWQIIGGEQGGSELGKKVALREPQRQAAEAALESAKNARSQAELAISKAAIRAPFNGFVKSEQVDEGQLVSPATQLATLVGSDAFWVQVSIPVDKVPYLDVPGLNVADGQGALATASQDVGGQRVERRGRVVRLLGDLDPVGRMARLLVEIEDPLDLRAGAKKKRERRAPAPGSRAGAGPASDTSTADGQVRAAKLPILLGAFVDVAIDAREVQDVREVPRLALHGGDQVYVYGKNDRLEIRKVEIVWRGDETVLVRSGLEPGENVIVSRLPNAVSGMRLRKLEKRVTAAERSK
jgi:RND family efflux transporter MFP subunit